MPVLLSPERLSATPSLYTTLGTVSSRPDWVKNCATIATSANQQGMEGTDTGEMWMSTEECVILRLYPPYQETMFVHPSKETHFCLFYKDFPSFVYEIFLTACLLSSRCASRGCMEGSRLHCSTRHSVASYNQCFPPEQAIRQLNLRSTICDLSRRRREWCTARGRLYTLEDA